MEIWSYRGVRGIAPENTMDAFIAALAMGCDGIALDVRLCSSGEPVVFFDPTLWRMCGSFISVRHTCLGDLQAYPLDEDKRTIVTLQEALSKLAGKTKLIINLISSSQLDAKLERAVRNNIVKYALDYISTITIASKSPLDLCKIHALFPNKKPKLALILEKKFSSSRIANSIFKFDAIHITTKLATVSNVEKWKKGGITVRVMEVCSINIAEELCDYGADAVLTRNLDKIV